MQPQQYQGFPRPQDRVLGTDNAANEALGLYCLLLAHLDSHSPSTRC